MPDFVIQHVIAEQGGAWFDIEEETEVLRARAMLCTFCSMCTSTCAHDDARTLRVRPARARTQRRRRERAQDDKKKARGMPDEGLPVPKPEIVEHLEKDVYDPDSGRLLGTIRDYCQLKEKLHAQVRFILSRARNNNAQTVNKAKEMRADALEKWVQVQAEMAQKIKDDARISDFDDGQRFYITLIGAENLPMFDAVRRKRGFAVCWRGRGPSGPPTHSFGLAQRVQKGTRCSCAPRVLTQARAGCSNTAKIRMPRS